jgi:hypothetical protein
MDPIQPISQHVRNIVRKLQVYEAKDKTRKSSKVIMGFTAIGFEKTSGEVEYVLWPQACDLDDLENIITHRSYPEGIDTIKTCSMIEYFNTMDKEEDTRWRIAFMLDGTVRCRLWSMSGEFIYTPVKKLCKN